MKVSKFNNGIAAGFTLLIILIGLIFAHSSVAKVDMPKCYDSNVQSHYYGLLVPVEGIASAFFTVPLSIKSDEAQDRLFGKPFVWERKNLWNKEIRIERYEQALIEIACLSRYGPSKLLAIRIGFLENAPLEVKKTKLYRFLDSYLKQLVEKNLTIDSNLSDLSEKIEPIFNLAEIMEFIGQLEEILTYTYDNPPNKVLSFFQGTPFNVYSDPSRWSVIRKWLTPFCDAAELIGKAAAVLRIYSTSQDIIISSFMAPLLANLYAIERLDRIEHAIQEQNANLWNDSAFQDALANSKNFLNESKSKQFLSTLLDELTDPSNAVDLINGAKTLAGVQFSKHVIGLINQQLTSHGLTALTHSAAGMWAIGLAALYQEFLLILEINQQLENAEMAVASSTIAKQLCNDTGDYCGLRVPAMYGYFASTEYMIDAYDWSFCWGCSDTVELWEDAKSYFKDALDHEWIKRCDKFRPIINPLPWITLLLLKERGDITSPTSPTGLVVNAVSAGQINLSWNASTDNVGVTGYKIYRDGSYLKSVTSTSENDMSLTSSTKYCYTVSAYDAAGNESDQSNQDCDTTESEPNTSNLPDTGVSKCYDSDDNEITCPPPGDPFYGQDANYGPNIHSYTKIDTQGYDLPPEAISWTMVRDNISALIWEKKTQDGGIHDKDNSYSWTDAINTFIESLNSNNFGGYSDWRLPTERELNFLANRGKYNPTIDETYFPNTKHERYYSDYWSSTKSKQYTNTSYGTVYFFGGQGDSNQMGDSNYVRAVRGDEFKNNFIDNGNGTVTDLTTGLMWLQKTINADLNDKNNTYTWEEALLWITQLNQDNYAGYNDWRLPNINELVSIFNREFSPAINSTFFPNNNSSTVDPYYWSSTPSPWNSINNIAWGVAFYGSTFQDIKSLEGTHFVRAVRDNN